MSLQLRDVPSLRHPPSSEYAVVGRPSRSTWLLDRRRFIRAATVSGMTAGIALLQVFPTSRRARASHEGSGGYQIYTPNNTRNCDFLASGAGTCAEPCGPSTIHPFACEPSGHKEGWHKDSNGWALRPNQCDGNSGIAPGADGWKWEPGSGCGDGCNPAVFRCHDGYHRHDGDPPDETQWHRSICAKRVQCG